MGTMLIYVACCIILPIIFKEGIRAVFMPFLVRKPQVISESPFSSHVYILDRRCPNISPHANHIAYGQDPSQFPLTVITAMVSDAKLAVKTLVAVHDELIILQDDHAWLEEEHCTLLLLVVTPCVLAMTCNLAQACSIVAATISSTIMPHVSEASVI